MEKNSNRIKADELLVRSQDLTTLLGFYKSAVLYGGKLTFQQWKALLDRQGWGTINDDQKRGWWKDNIERLDRRMTRDGK